MAWHRPGDNPLSGPMMVTLLMDICITQPQWVKHMVVEGVDAAHTFRIYPNILMLHLFHVANTALYDF